VTDKGVVVLQNCLDLPEVMPGSYNDSCLSSHNGNDVEEVLDIKEEDDDSVPVSSPVIKDEYEVRCMVVSVVKPISQILRTGYYISHCHLSVSMKEIHTGHRL
jgi:hypothetical protein